MKTLVLVVLYNKIISESFTLTSLNCLENNNFDLIIVNNGPLSILNDFKGHDIKVNGSTQLIEYLWNKPLSNLYNDVINNNPNYDRYILLDDDTQIPNKFINNLNDNFEENINMQLPLIKNISDNKIYYPRVNNKIVDNKILLENISLYNEFHSIGSGLVLYKSLVDIFKKYNLKIFDERFVFYGVDVSIFRRIMFLKQKYKVFFNIRVVSCLDHSLSEHEANFSDWKKREMLYADVLMIRHYCDNNFILIIRFSKYLLKNLIKLNINKIILSIKTFFRGSHPKSNY